MVRKKHMKNSYLINCIQVVKLFSVVLIDSKVHSGIPQRSHLGPLLFILFINDLPSIFDTPINVLMFDDNTKIFSVSFSHIDCIRLQFNLDKSNEWNIKNELPFKRKVPD